MHHGRELDAKRLAAFSENSLAASDALSGDLRWLLVLKEGLGHEPFLVEAQQDGQTVGLLPLAFVRSFLFGRFLVGLPYLNSGGVRAANEDVAGRLIDRAVELAESLRVRYLELRHESPCEHSALTKTLTSKVHMRLPLPATSDALWDGFKSKLRSQIRSGQKHEFQVNFGGEELLPAFYDVFSRNMRDLGTPVYGRALFRAILRHFPHEAELCVLRDGSRPVAGALLLHGPASTEVPSASSLRSYNSSNANMVMYWRLLDRAVSRGQRSFDFGRSTIGSGPHRFKEQWGAEPSPAVWQYHLRQGDVGDMRPDSPRYQRAIRVWKRLPLAVTRWVGPMIVRGIP